MPQRKSSTIVTNLFSPFLSPLLGRGGGRSLLLLFALFLILSACTSKRSSMLRQMAEINALCDNYDTLPNDTAALEVVAYMERCGTLQERQEAWRMLSRVYRQKGWGFFEESAYSMAVGCIDTTQAFDTLALAQTLYEWSQCLDRSLDYEQSKEQVWRAVRYALAAGDTLHAMRYYCHIEPDSAYRYLWSHGAKEFAADASIPYIEQFREKMGADSAWMLLNRYARDTRSNLTHPLSYEAENYWILRGLLHRQREEYDSALYYFHKVNDLGSKRWREAGAAAHYLAFCFEEMGEEDSAQYYLGQNYSIVELGANRLQNDRFRSRFHDYQIQRDNMDMRDEAERLHLWMLAGAFILLFVIVIVVVRYAHLRRQHRETLQQNREYADVLQSLRADRDLSLLDAPIVGHFHELSSQDKHPTADDWQALFAHIEASRPSFFAALTAPADASTPAYVPTEQERRVISLIAIRCTPLQMSVLLVCTKSNVSNLRRRLYRRLTGQEGAGADLDRLVAGVCSGKSSF